MSQSDGVPTTRNLIPKGEIVYWSVTESRWPRDSVRGTVTVAEGSSLYMLFTLGHNAMHFPTIAVRSVVTSSMPSGLECEITDTSLCLLTPFQHTRIMSQAQDSCTAQALSFINSVQSLVTRTEEVIVDGNALDIPSVIAVSRSFDLFSSTQPLLTFNRYNVVPKLSRDEHVQAKVEQAAGIIQHSISSGGPLYGVTTGVGASGKQMDYRIEVTTNIPLSIHTHTRRRPAPTGTGCKKPKWNSSYPSSIF